MRIAGAISASSGLEGPITMMTSYLDFKERIFREPRFLFERKFEVNSDSQIFFQNLFGVHSTKRRQ